MRWARFDNSGTPTYAVVEDDVLISVRGSPFATWERTGTRQKLAGTKLLPPVIPPTFYACRHQLCGAPARGGRKDRPGAEHSDAADIGYRANNALIGTDDPIVIPADATEQGAVRGRARGGHRQQGEASVARRSAVLRAWATRSATT